MYVVHVTLCPYDVLFSAENLSYVEPAHDVDDCESIFSYPSTVPMAFFEDDTRVEYEIDVDELLLMNPVLLLHGFCMALRVS